MKYLKLDSLFNFFACLILAITNFAQFWPFYLQRFLPFPGDILVAFYFPWSGGGFVGFDPWTTYKALNTVDVIKQFYPWKVFAMDLINKGIWPMWNPYSFSGMPFIANLQSGVFFPTNVFFLFIPTLWAWVGTVLFDLLFFGGCLYLFLRSEKLSRIASVFGAIVGMNLSYLTLWHYQLVITQSAIFLPLILYFVNRYIKKQNNIFLPGISLLIALSFFGGHVQTVIFVYLIFLFFALFKRLSFKKIIITSILPLFIAAVQLLPSTEAYLLSAREGIATKELFAPFVFHWKNIVTVLAPDFFGHPSNRNYVGTDYRDMNAYFGLTAFIFSIISAWWVKKDKRVLFFFFVALFGLLFSTWPLVFVFDFFNIPILSSGVPARMIFIFQFGGAVLSAFGFDYWLKERMNFSKKIIVNIFFVGVCIVLLWIFASTKVSRNNLILPTLFFVGTSSLLLLKTYISRLTVIFVTGIFILSFAQYSYFFQKYNSFSPSKFVFPEHPVLSYLKNNAGIYRFFGTNDARLSYDFSVYYKLYDFEGYDSMYPKRYGELISAAVIGEVPKSIPRSDAFLNNWKDRRSSRLLDLLGVKFLTEKNDLPESNWDLEINKFPVERFKLVWQEKIWKIYERKTALPRVGLFDNFLLINNGKEIIKKIYNDDFDYKNVVILEKAPKILPRDSKNKMLKVVSYAPNKIIIQTSSDVSQLLYLSDNYYPGWKVYVDGKEQEILRANYTFRAVSLSDGNHLVVFEYRPELITLGVISTFISLILILCFVLKYRR